MVGEFWFEIPGELRSTSRAAKVELANASMNSAEIIVDCSSLCKQVLELSTENKREEKQSNVIS